MTDKPEDKDKLPPEKYIAQRVGVEHMSNHLYRHPTHFVEVSNTGMPAEFILAVCQAEGCRWEAQW